MSVLFEMAELLNIPLGSNSICGFSVFKLKRES